MKHNSVIRTNELDSKEFFLRADKYFLSGLLLAILISILGNYIYLVLVLLIFYLFKREWGDRFLLSATILLYLTFVTDIIHSFRFYVQLIGFLILLYVFFKKFGFKTNEFPHLPKDMKLFILTFYISMILATVFSNYVGTGLIQIFKQTIFY